MSTELDTLGGVSQGELEALRKAQQEDMVDDTSFTTPILKVCQSLTDEVKSGDAEEGEFFNTLTGESYGNIVEFVVAYYQPGRAMSVKGGGYFTSVAEDLIPERWAPAVGPEFVGTRFDEHPDAEEQFKKRVNAGEHKWESGPKISTTYNYTGLVIPSSEFLEEDEDPEPLPVRLTFKRIDKDAHRKIKTLKEATSLRNKDFWSVVFQFSTEVKPYGSYTPYVVKVKKSRASTQEEQAQALHLALAVRAGRTQANEEASIESRASSASDDEPSDGLPV